VRARREFRPPTSLSAEARAWSSRRGLCLHTAGLAERVVDDVPQPVSPVALKY